MKILAKYLCYEKIEIANELICKFLLCNQIVENKGGVSGMRMVYLYSYLLDENNANEEINNRVLKSLIEMSYKNGKNEVNHKTVDLIRTKILPKYTNREIDINLDFITDDNTWEKTRNLFIECAYEGGELPMNIRQKVFYWLKGSGKKMDIFSEDYILKKYITKNNDSEQTDTNISDEKKNIPVVSNNKDTIVKFLDNKENGQKFDIKIHDSFNWQECIVHLVSYITTQEKVVTNIRNEINNLRADVEKLYSKYNKSLENEQMQENRIQEFMLENHKIKVENKELSNSIQSLQTMINSLNKEIDDRKQYTDTVARNREKQSEEYINRLASKLKIDYKDFADAKNLEMNIDLGENMRAQLESVFNILEKNGLKFK
jgi:hypothetical protein